ncbi:MAG: putative nucleotidyltransferase with HDIG domain [Phycisphaerales bacterium]|jgi:putative nucleotidyltransferase with HDIG domain
MAPQGPDRAKQIDLILQRVDQLPTLSPVATRLLSIGSAEDADLDEIITLLESDPALSVTILGLCRRSNTGLGDKISTVRRAVVMLGLETVQSAVLSVSVYALIRNQQAEAGAPEEPLTNGSSGSGESDESTFDQAGLWKHAVAVACATELLAKEHKHLGVRPDGAFVAGLLHDLGKLILELALPRAYARVLQLAETRQADSAAIERTIIGVDHHTVGKRLAERWGLPRAVQDVIWLHSQPLESLPDVDHRGLVALVTLAKSWCREQHLGWSGDFGTAMSSEKLCRDLSMDSASLNRVLPRLAAEVSERCKLLGLDDISTPQLLLESITHANKRLSRLNAQLDRRARLSEQRGKTLGAISTFHNGWDATRSVLETLGSIVHSASGLLGDGFYGVVYADSNSDTWQIHQFTPEGLPILTQIATPPSSIAETHELIESLADSTRLTMAAMGALPWLSDYLNGTVDLRTVRFLPLVTPAAESDGFMQRLNPGPTALLLHDRDPAASGLEMPELRGLIAAWSSALTASAHHEQIRRLGEQLAESNRHLAEAQHALTERESLVRLGEMSAGAAHEMNNPLTIIRGRSQLLADRLDNARDRAAAAAIAEAADSLSELITALHLLADPPEPRFVSTDPMLVLHKAVEAARTATGEMGESTTVRIEGGEGLPRISTDLELLARALAEIVTNAIEAGNRKMVRITVQPDPVDRRLVLRVIDLGPGMSPRALKHAFDPFFSDKPAGRQPGLGLSKARGLLELCGGSIRLANAPDRGAVITVSLPLSDENQAANAA